MSIPSYSCPACYLKHQCCHLSFCLPQFSDVHNKHWYKGKVWNQESRDGQILFEVDINLSPKGLYHYINGCIKLDSGSKKCWCARQSIEYAPTGSKVLASDTLSVCPMIPVWNSGYDKMKVLKKTQCYVWHCQFTVKSMIKTRQVCTSHYEWYLLCTLLAHYLLIWFLNSS